MLLKGFTRQKRQKKVSLNTLFRVCVPGELSCVIGSFSKVAIGDCTFHFLICILVCSIALQRNVKKVRLQKDGETAGG